jgi:predicted nuclease with RNAse H fold
MRIVGIDLTGSERRASGWALLDHCNAETALVRTDQELISRTIRAKPSLVSIDSPLSLPSGLATIAECEKRGLPIYRSCELALKRMGISVFWCLLPSMRSLTERGMRLASALRAAGLRVIESYPGAAQDLMRIPRKGASLEELRWGLRRAGINGDFMGRETSHDEVDAITSALVGLFYIAGEYLALGNSVEDYLIVPRVPQINYPALDAILRQTGLDPISRTAQTSLQCA